MNARDVSLHELPNSSRPHVVIVGGGFGGLYAARGLARAPVHLTVVDQHNYHLFRPLLYQVATGLLSADEIAAPIRSILRKQKNTVVLMAEVIDVDTQHHLVQTQDGSLPYDYLILATGSHYNYFGHDEWVTLAPGLHSADDADLIRSKILRAFEEAERLATNAQVDPSILQALLTFILVGGGTAGVEMAGTIAEMARMALVHDFRHIDPRSARIVLFEAAPRILPGYPEQLSTRAHHHLEQLGVQVRPGTKVEAVEANGVVVAGQPIGSRTVVWTAGVVASPAGQWLAVETDGAGRVKVELDLSVPGHPNVFAIGDTALVVAPTRNLFGIRSRDPVALPGVAQPAIQEGKHVASVIRRRVARLPPLAPFCYRDKGSLAIVGRTFAVADVPPFRFWGVLAWLLWLGVHIYALIGFANRLLVMIQWGLSFMTKRRGVRILSQRQWFLEKK